MERPQPRARGTQAQEAREPGLAGGESEETYITHVCMLVLCMVCVKEHVCCNRVEPKHEDGAKEKCVLEKCPFVNSQSDDQTDISGILQYTAAIVGIGFPTLRERFGEEFFGLCLEENERVLRSLGGNLQDFFNGFDALLEHARTSYGRRASSESPSFLCKDGHGEKDGDDETEKGTGKTLLLHCFNPDPTVGVAMPGLIRAAARRIYQSEVRVEETDPTWLHVANEDGELSADSTPSSSPSPPTSTPPACLSFLIREVKSSLSSSSPSSSSRQLSRSPVDLRISLSTFCRACPFHLVIGPTMEVLQVGEGLRQVGEGLRKPHRTLSFSDSFQLVSPRIPCSFQNILLRLATPFTIRTRPDSSALDSKEKLEHPHTVPADGAVGVEVEGHQAFWTCDDKPSIPVLTTVPPHTDSLGVSTKTKAGLVTEDDPLPF
ncbi:hypothetical protein NFI96_006372 [Prochilodus magdalenae]|nr:hypothetical protein NFI96_006372 [Prochilodus magdalenae]